MGMMAVLVFLIRDSIQEHCISNDIGMIKCTCFLYSKQILKETRPWYKIRVGNFKFIQFFMSPAIVFHGIPVASHSWTIVMCGIKRTTDAWSYGTNWIKLYNSLKGYNVNSPGCN